MDQREYINSSLYEQFSLWFRRTMACGTILFVSLGALDYLVAPEHFSTFLGYRAAISATFLAVWFLFAKTKSKLIGYLLAIFIVLASVATIEAMILKLGGDTSTYYVGMLLVILCCGFIPVPLWVSAIYSALTYLTYVIPILVFDDIVDQRAFITANFFIVSILGTELVLHYLRGRRLGDEFRLKWQLVQSEERARRTFESAPIGMALVGLDGRFLQVNQALSNILGYGATELLSRTMRQMVHPADSSEAIWLVGKDKGPRADPRSDVRFVHADGHVIWTKTSTTLVGGGRGQEEYFILQSEDVTASKRAEEERQKLVSIIESSSDFIAMASLQNRLLYLNSAGRRLLGLSDPRGVQELQLSDCVEEDVRGEFVRQTSTAMSSDSDRKWESRLKHSVTGASVPVECTAFPLKDPATKSPVAMAVVLRDLSQRKKMEEELLKARSLESLGTLAGGIAHDFNNLLTAVIGNVGLARIGMKSTDRGYKRLMEAEKASAQAKELTRQLLTFSKGGAPLKEAASIQVLVRDSAGFAVRGSKVVCEFDFPQGLWDVDADAGQISQVVNNLVLNSVQAMPDGGVARVSCENVVLGPGSGSALPVGKYVKVSVRDQGVGIPKEHLSRIFDPYFTTKPGGAGLGLSVVHSIVRNHGGEIRVESESGVGSSFSFCLPAARVRAPARRPPSERIVGGRGRVLVLEDEPLVSDVAGEILTTLGYQVECAADGQQALDLYERAKAENNPFHLLILDLTIPGGMGGKEVIARVRAKDREVKAIVASGYSNDSAMAEFEEHGFTAAVRKPYRLQELSEVVHGVMTGLN